MWVAWTAQLTLGRARADPQRARVWGVLRGSGNMLQALLSRLDTCSLREVGLAGQPLPVGWPWPWPDLSMDPCTRPLIFDGGSERRSGSEGCGS